MAHALRLDHDSSRALRFFQRSILRATFRRWRAQVHPVHVFVRDPERLFSRQCDAFRFADVHGLFRLDFVRLVENCPLRLVRTRANTVKRVRFSTRRVMFVAISVRVEEIVQIARHLRGHGRRDVERRSDVLQGLILRENRDVLTPLLRQAREFLLKFLLGCDFLRRPRTHLVRHRVVHQHIVQLKHVCDFLLERRLCLRILRLCIVSSFIQRIQLGSDLRFE
mmetsp:Transcript_4871/g.18677  ORF Transcript_4871/g.18677 Transcript_4871/m.18677 type:complete len:223 (-) Transcript_4871:538-1206(-)